MRRQDLSAANHLCENRYRFQSWVLGVQEAPCHLHALRAVAEGHRRRDGGKQLGCIPDKLTGVLLVPKLKEIVISPEAAARDGAVFAFANKKLDLLVGFLAFHGDKGASGQLRVMLLNSSLLLGIGTF